VKNYTYKLNCKSLFFPVFTVFLLVGIKKCGILGYKNVHESVASQGGMKIESIFARRRRVGFENAYSL
jgi:hypothetical protein